MNAAPASLSFVVEWENAERIGASRAHRMLDALHRQLSDPAIGPIGTCELIFVYDGSGESSEGTIAAAVGENGRTWPARIRFAPAPTGEYYEQKNLGAALATGDIIVFLDSDVVPQPGWLASLLAAFADPRVEVVSGTTFVDVSDFYSAAMALGWIFRLRSDHGPLTPARAAYANNLAMRREVARAHPFPKTGQYRGQCGYLCEALRQHGHVIWVNPSAAASHPPPEWFLPFAVRALWAGHDGAIALRASGRGLFWRGLAGLARDAASSIARIWIRRRRVRFGPLRAAGASALLILYHAFKSAGFLLCCVAPAGTRRAVARLGARAERGGLHQRGQTRFAHGG